MEGIALFLIYGFLDSKRNLLINIFIISFLFESSN